MTEQVLIVALALVVIVAIVAFAQWRIRVDELAAEEHRVSGVEASRAAGRARDEDRKAEVAALQAPGPAEGAKVGVHVGDHLIQGTRVLRDDPDAKGWIVLDGAELLDGARATPLGGRQWVREAQWVQEL